MPIKTFYPDGVTTMFDSDNVAGGVCLGSFFIAAGTSFSKSWSWMAGAAVRVTDVSGSSTELTGVSISISNSPYPSVSIAPAPHDHVILIWAVGATTIQEMPGMQAVSSNGGVALHPSARGLNYIAKASYVELVPGWAMEGRMSTPYWIIRAPSYFTQNIRPVPIIDLSAGYYTSPVVMRWNGSYWFGFVQAFSTVPTNATGPSMTAQQPDVFLFGKPLAPAPGMPVAAVYDDDGTLAFDLLAGPLLASVGHVEFAVNEITKTAPAGTRLGIFGDPLSWQVSGLLDEPYEYIETGFWRLSGGSLTRHLLPVEIINDGNYASSDYVNQSRRATSVEFIELTPY